MDRIFTIFATWAARLAGQPFAFLLAVGVVFVWVVTGPMFGWSDTWQLVINTGTTIVTFVMVFLIQNSQNRDAAAMQAKLDEIIRSLDRARQQFIGIEHLTDGQIEEIRTALEREAGSNHRKPNSSQETVERLLSRY
jgi:low affinity Fe/Cu permease